MEIILIKYFIFFIEVFFLPISFSQKKLLGHASTEHFRLLSFALLSSSARTSKRVNDFAYIFALLFNTYSYKYLCTSIYAYVCTYVHMYVYGMQQSFARFVAFYYVENENAFEHFWVDWWWKTRHSIGYENKYAYVP